MKGSDASGFEGWGRSDGMTLLEVVAVAAVLMVLMAVVVPVFATAKKVSNESAAVATLRTITNAQLQYHTRFGSYGDLPALESAGLVDAGFRDGERTGYRFVTSGAPSALSWAVVAEPVTPGVSGDRYFYVDESGVIRYREGAPPTDTDAPVD